MLLNLAITWAREGEGRLLVIEGDHQAPRVAERFGVVNVPGLRELLNGSRPVKAALQPTAQPRLFALPPGDPDLPVSHEAEAGLPDVIGRLRRRFEGILVNAPAWGSGGSAEWAAFGDAVYLVVRRDQWDTAEVEAAHEAIIAGGGKLRGYITLRECATSASDAA